MTSPPPSPSPDTEHLAERIRAALPGQPPYDERRMFGGRAFMVDGKMAVAIIGTGEVMIRLDPDDAEMAVDRGAAQPMVMRGRPITGWVWVAPSNDDALSDWVRRGTACARRLAAGGR